MSPEENTAKEVGKIVGGILLLVMFLFCFAFFAYVIGEVISFKLTVWKQDETIRIMKERRANGDNEIRYEDIRKEIEK